MTLLPHHAAELINGSGIDPAIVASRGYRSVTAAEVCTLGFAPSQCRSGLLMPQWTLAGVQVGYLIKPDNPRTVDGRLLKYEAPFGSVPHFDMHPAARHLLNNPSTPLYVTEGSKKADSGWSRGLACISVTGVWMFVNKRLVVPDLDEIALTGRTVRVVFDSDVTRKESVTEALCRLCEVLRRRGATVEVIYLPEGPGGAKVGLDDFFVAGGTVANLNALTVRWDGKGPGVWLRHADEDDGSLARQLAAAQDDNRALVEAIYTLSLVELRFAVSTGALVANKASRHITDDAGDVTISPGEVSNDYRPKPEAKGKLGPTNPDGSRPRMSRSTVKKLMQQAVAAGVIRARPIPVDRRHATSGATWRDTDWVVSPVGSLAEILNPWIAARTQAPKERKPRTVALPCRNCGEVHEVTQIGYCGSTLDPGCGAQIGEPRIIPVLRETGDKLSPVRDVAPSDPLPIGIQDISGLPEEPSWMADAPPTDWRDTLSPVSPDADTGLDAPPLFEAQEILAAADRGDDDALHALADQLAPITAQRGKTPVPKPRRETVTPAGVAGDDHWTWS